MADKINDGMTPQERYDKSNRVAFHFRLNQKTDADIIAKLEEVKNKQGYFKSLVRADIARNSETSET